VVAAAATWSVDAVRKIEAQQARIAHRYELGHLAEDIYKQRWEELERDKEQWRHSDARAGVTPALPIANLATGWTLASPRQKRDMLALLFEKAVGAPRAQLRDGPRPG
jgi:hypothetical protein